MDLRSTLNLPDAEFTIPMKADLSGLEPRIQAEWDAQSIYHTIQDARKDAEPFVLHDGPPYTNSPIHLGTALNKILKDFVVKSRTMMGHRSPYVPGFDNHGLPIEQTVLKAFAERKERPDVVTLRKACREHARRYIDIQTAQFKRLGIFGFWERPYTTMDFRFEAEIVRTFRRLVEGGYIYRGLRPTLWSPSSRTALADTEIVYHDHTSTAILVRFPLKDDPNRIFEHYPNLHTVIWTTTPWTIPANLAVAFHPELDYAVVKVGDEHYLLYEGLVAKTAETVGWKDFEVVRSLQGINVGHAIFGHPLVDRDSLAIMAEYVTTEDGTGVVHTAPGHGRDDFYSGLANHLPVLCPVDERGMMTEEAGEFAGLSYIECNAKVVERLREVGHLLDAREYQHSYPYAERDDKPVIFRATEQWFVAIDHNHLRTRMLEAVETVKWFPASGENRIRSMIAGRPDWCISRQRPWGVGIPIFYGVPSGEPVLDPVAIESVAQLVEREGSDAWFERDPAEILPKGYQHPETGETEFRKETDVLDVWFDSGSTSLCVLEGNVEPKWKDRYPANVYLEGSDQHRGWFNSSMVIAMATRDEAPYEEVVTHGFTIDEQGRKMSKRLGNTIDPVEACDKYGADVLRYWTAGVDYNNDMPCSDNLLKQFGESYRRIRNTLRFLLSNLYDYDPTAKPELLELDEWVIEQTELLVADCAEKYRQYEFGAVMTAVHNFCVNELSAFYLDAIKDRMYCDGKDWPSRRSGQVACHGVLVSLVKLLAPVLCHTAEETYARIPGIDRLQSVHMDSWTEPDEMRLQEIEANDLQQRMAQVLSVRSGVFAAFEQWKGENGVKDSQDVVAVITETGDALAALKSMQDDLAILFKMSEVTLEDGESAVRFSPSPYEKCERSRVRRADIAVVDGVPLSARDRRALGK